MSSPTETQRQLDDAERLVQRRALRQMQTRALALLLAAVVLLVLAHGLRQQSPAWGYVQAFAEAAIVGAMADWFAVVALFRHPLGLPIWHTAIIPERKDDISRSLGRFVETHFVTEQGVAERIRLIDPARRLGTWLQQPEHSAPLARQLSGALEQVLAGLDQEQLKLKVRELCREQLLRIDLSGHTGALLDMLMARKKHQELLNAVLDGMERYLTNAEHQPVIVQFLVSSVAGDNAIAKIAINSFAPKAITAIAHTLGEVRGDEAHAFRAKFDEWMGDFAVKLKDDPAWREQLRAYQHNVLHSPQTEALLDGVWVSLMDKLQADLQREESAVAGQLQRLCEHLGGMLAEQPGLRDWLNSLLVQGGRNAVRKYQGAVSRFIEEQLAQWSREEMSERIELAIGRDLQFIRINGTLVGGLMGLLIYAVMQVLG